jgi:hypothetical protein
MRRYTLYFAVALLAFGIGSLVVFNFYSKDKNNFPKIDSSKESQLQNDFAKSDAKEKIDSKLEYACNDEAHQTVWNNLQKNNDFSKTSADYIKEIQGKKCLEIFDNVKNQDLNDDGVNEVIIQSNSNKLCSSPRNCSTWIVSKVQNQNQIIFDSLTAASFGGLTFLHERTNKFNNLKIRINRTVGNSNIAVFKFDGEKYQLKKCFEDFGSGGIYDYEKPSKERLRSVKLDKCL